MSKGHVIFQPLIFRVLALAVEATELWRVTMRPSIWAYGKSQRNHRRCLITFERPMFFDVHLMCVSLELDMFLSLENRLDILWFMTALIIHLHGFCFLQGSCTTGQIIVIVLVQTILAKNVSFQCFPCLPRSKCSRLMRSGDGLLPTDGLPCTIQAMFAGNAWEFPWVYLPQCHAILLFHMLWESMEYMSW